MISALGVVAAAFVLILFFSVYGTKNPRRAFRSIKAFQRLQRSIELSVEDGSRLQISLGHGGLLGPQSAAAFAGLTLLRQVADIAADSDTLRTTYRRLGIRDQFHLRLAQTTGVTPFSYAAGTLPLILDRAVLSSALIGSFGNEVGLIGDASQRIGGFALGGSDNLSSQSILFAVSNEPLIGEELYATGAYTGAGNAHQASLRTQDLLRWLIILFILISAFSPLFAGLE